MSAELEREATELLAGLLADAAKKGVGKAGVVLPGAFVRVKRGPMPGARSTAKTSESPQGAAKRRAAQSATMVGE